MKTTGLDSAAAIPAGATITSTRWAVPGHYGTRTEFDWEDEALAHAISEREAAQAKHAEFYPDEATRVPLPEAITIDLRWRVAYPGGGSLDTVASRTVYETLAEARAVLMRVSVTCGALRAQARGRLTPSTASPRSILNDESLDRAGRALTELDHTDDWTHGDYDDPFVRMCARDAARTVITEAIGEDTAILRRAATREMSAGTEEPPATPQPGSVRGLMDALRITQEVLASQPGLGAPSPLETNIKLFLQATPGGQADEGRVIHAIARMNDVDAGDVTEAISNAVTRGTVHRRGTLLVLS